MVAFAINLSILKHTEYLNSYNEMKLFGFMLSTFRISIGDTEFNDFEFNPPGGKSQDDDTFYGSKHIYRFMYLYWVIALIVLNVVFMNFIIAVISESYNRVMENVEAEVYKVRAHMILEREAFIPDDTAHEYKEYFPRFILMRQPVTVGATDEEEIHNLIREMKFEQQRLCEKFERKDGEMKKELEEIKKILV